VQEHEHLEHPLLRVAARPGGRRPHAAARPGSAAARLARRGLAATEGRAIESTHRLRFPTNSAAVAAGLSPFPGDLYDGAAGVAAVLLEAACLDAAGRARRLGRAVIDGLVASTPPGASAEPTGLYLGLAGTAVTVARWGIAEDDPALVDEALRVMRLAAVQLPETCDMLGGVAGVGLAALALHEATGEPAMREAVHACVAALAARARPWGGGLGWPVGQDAPDGSVRADDLQTGFAHGLAGVAAFLVRAAPLDEGARALEHGAFAALRALARPRDEALAWPVSDRDPTERHHWCHGSTGIAHAWLARHAVTGDTESLRMAEQAAEHAWRALARPGRRPDDRTVGHCHGLAGALELFALLARRAAPGRWDGRVHAIVRAIGRRTQGRGPSSLDADGCGAAYGTAGVVRAMLLVEGAEVWLPWSALPEGRVRERARRPPPRPLPPPARAVRARLPSGMRLVDVVPQAAGALVGAGYALPLDSRHDDALARHAEAALASPVGREFRALLTEVEARRAALATRHADWLARDALGAAVLGPLVRECAAILLRPSPSPRAARRRVMRRLVDRHFRGLARCLEHVEADRAGVLARVASGAVTRVEHFGGDPHRGEAGVFALGFADGREWVHKPRSVRLDGFIAGTDADGAAALVADRLRAVLPGALLARHDVLPAGPWHGYAERIVTRRAPIADGDPVLRFLGAELGVPPAVECTRLRPGDEPRFWVAAGLLAAHSACLGLADLHAENLVAGTSRASPDTVLHAVDLEMAFLADGSVAAANLTPQFGHPREADPAAHLHWGLDVSHGGLCTMGAETWCTLVTPEGLVATRRPGQLAGRHAPNAVRNGDGSVGCGPFLPALLRGFADYWSAVRPILPAMAARARALLHGEIVRVLAKASRAYVAALHARSLGEPLWPGAAWHDVDAVAEAFSPEERAQLDALDVPYFFARLGEPGLLWMDGAAEWRSELVAKTVLADPFWSVIERFGEADALGYGIADLAAFGAPPGAFDLRDDRLGVRVRRTTEDPRIAVALALQDGVVRFRLEPDGRVRRWDA
jgi:hypothetical protein